jgi:glycosyltransferase 2 family protein
MATAERPVVPIVPGSFDDEQTAETPPDGLGKRLLRPQTLISFGLAAGIVVFVVTRLDIDVSAVWRNLRNANPLLFLTALGLYYATFILRAIRWRGMLAQAGIDDQHGYVIPGYPRFVEILLLSWFVNCIIPAKLGDAYRCYLFKRESNASFSATLGTLLAERLTDLVVLFVTMATAGMIAFHGNVPSQVTQTFLIGMVLLAVGGAALTAVGIGRDRFKRVLPMRFHGQFELFHVAIFACLRQPWRPVAISLLMWMMDGLRLFLVAKSLGASLSFELAIFVALMSALLTTLPITPAGLGVVEAAMIVVLKLVAIDPTMASSIAILDRLIGYWSLIVVGLFLYVRRFRSDVRAATTPTDPTT